MGRCTYEIQIRARTPFLLSCHIVFGPRPSRESCEQCNPGGGSDIRIADNYFLFSNMCFTSVFHAFRVSLKNKTRIIHYRHRRMYIFVFLCYRPLYKNHSAVRVILIMKSPTITTLGTWLTTVSIGQSNHTTALVVT